MLPPGDINRHLIYPNLNDNYLVNFMFVGPFKPIGMGGEW
jgi:hypothetical protein